MIVDHAEENTIAPTRSVVRRASLSLFVFAVSCFFTLDAQAQDWLGNFFNSPGRYQKENKEVFKAFVPAVESARKGTLLISVEGADRCYGAAWQSGYVVTKASVLAVELNEEAALACKSWDGEEREAQLLAIDEQLDLAILSIPDSESIEPLNFAAQGEDIGSWVISPGIEEEPLAFGVVSVAPRKINRIFAPANAFLGIRTEFEDSKLSVLWVQPDSAASEAGLAEGDILKSVNGKKIKTREVFLNIMSKREVGDSVEIEVLRKGKTLDLVAVLRARPESMKREDPRAALYGDLSERRTGFELAMQHDTVLEPSECGGPLVNLKGEVVGLNIARSGRVESLALPVKIVSDFVANFVAGLAKQEKQAAPSDSRIETLEKIIAAQSSELEALKEARKLKEEMAKLEDKLKKERQKRLAAEAKLRNMKKAGSNP